MGAPQCTATELTAFITVSRRMLNKTHQQNLRDESSPAWLQAAEAQLQRQVSQGQVAAAQALSHFYTIHRQRLQGSFAVPRLLQIFSYDSCGAVSNGGDDSVSPEVAPACQSRQLLPFLKRELEWGSSHTKKQLATPRAGGRGASSGAGPHGRKRDGEEPRLEAQRWSLGYPSGP